MKFGGIQLTTTLDYPGQIATTLFVKGCNMRCGFCHNASIASGEGSTYDSEDIFKKLISRKAIIDHVCITGGEPSLYGQELIQFIIRLKNNGFKIKLDTNGMNPDFIRRVLGQNPMIDYIAMDIKTCLEVEEYGRVICKDFTDLDLEHIKDSIDIIMRSGIEKEFRTTVVKTYHSPEILKKISAIGLPNHFFQQFVKSDQIYDTTLEAYSEEELRKIVDEINLSNSHIRLRGI